MNTRTQKEKMLAGERYNFFDPELDHERATAKQILLQFNRCEDQGEQQALIRSLLGAMGDNSLIWPPFYCTYGRNTYLGHHVFLNYNCVILDNNTVRFGNHVMVGPAVQFYTAAHPLEAETRNQGFEVARPITIGNNIWIGGSAVILPGVRIGDNAVIGAGAVVTKDVEPFTVVAGNPAREIRRLS